MTENDAPSPWQPDPGDAVNPDLTTGASSEDLDEDRIGLDPLEEGMDPPERWAASNRFGVGADEQHDGETLDQRLAQETDDVDPDDPDAVDERAEPQRSGEINEVGPQPDPFREAADEAGGSAARGWRTLGGDDQQ